MLGFIVNLAVKVRRTWRDIHRISPFGSHIMLTAGTNILLAGLGLITGSLAARLLGPQGRGELAAIQLWPGFIMTLAMLGLPEAQVYFSVRQPDQAGRYFSSGLVLALLPSLPFMMVGYFTIPMLLGAQSPEIIAAARWYLFVVPVSALVGMPYNPLQGRNDFIAWNGLRLTPAIMWLVVLGLAWLLGRVEPLFIALSYLVALALLSVPTILVMFRRVPGPFYPQARMWGSMLRYGLPSLVSSLPSMLNLRLAQMLMVAFLPAHMLGLYTVALSWGFLPNPLLGALGPVLFPRVASRGDSEQQGRLFVQGSRLGVLFSGVMGAIVFALTPLAIPLLFGKEFVSAIPAGMVLVVAGAIIGLNLTLKEGLRGLGHPGTLVKAEFIGLAVMVILLVLLLQPLGVMGAALAMLFSTCAILFVLIIQGRKLTGYPLLSFLCPTLDEVWGSWRRIEAIWEALR